jgi:LemA protein
VYNGLVTARNAYKNAFAQIDVQLTRRYDLIPNLVETARAYLKHERETLQAVIAARNAAASHLKSVFESQSAHAAAQRRVEFH